LPPGKKVVRVVFNQIIKLLTNIICKVDADQLNKVPLVGPLIVISNHVNFLELPMIYPRVPSDLGIGFSKEENWKIWFYRILFSVWDLSPSNREEVDLTALRGASKPWKRPHPLHRAGGQRSHDGYLQVEKPGVVMLAQRTSAWWYRRCYGGEKFAENIKRLRGRSITSPWASLSE
jgi:1-acyl-sn-glycerol-3-phosphate acyltransferase